MQDKDQATDLFYLMFVCFIRFPNDFFDLIERNFWISSLFSLNEKSIETSVYLRINCALN